MNTLKLKRYGFLLFVCAVILCLSGCVEIDAPLVNPQAARVDTNLSGIWTRTVQNDKGETVATTYTVGACEPSDNQPSGMMTAISTDFNSTTSVTTTGDREYFVASQDNKGNLYISRYDGIGKPDPSSDRWYLSRYRVTGNELHIIPGQDSRPGSDSEVESLIKQGVLMGTTSTSDGRVSTTVATQASMVQYLNAHSGDDLFPSDEEVVYTRNSSSDSVPSPPPAGQAPVSSPPPVPPVTTTSPVQPVTTTPVNTSSPSQSSPALLPWIIVAFGAGIFITWMLVQMSKKKS